MPRLWEQAATCGICGSGRLRFTEAVGSRRFAICLDCGVERLHDRIAEERLGLLYANYYASTDPTPDALEQQLSNPTFAHRRERLERWIGSRTRRLLEIGCGDGNFLAAMRRAGWDVHGQEFSAATAAIVERRHRIPMFTGPLDVIPADETFPVVGAYHVFEHIYHPAAWLRRVRDLIERGGLLHLQVPNGASLTRRLSRGMWAGLVFPQHVYLYTPGTLTAVLNRFGFRVLGTTTWDPWHCPGSVAASVSNVANRLLSGRRPWSDEIDETPSSVAPRVAPTVEGRGLKRLLRAGLERASDGAARVEAALGRGAVVDIVAVKDSNERDDGGV